jgi:hypothetical protein
MLKLNAIVSATDLPKPYCMGATNSCSKAAWKLWMAYLKLHGSVHRFLLGIRKAICSSYAAVE